MTLLVKHALKVALGAAIVGAVFQQSDSIPIIHYPAMGLVSTMQSNAGGTLKAGWGRLGGSAVGGLIGALLWSVWGGNPITSGIAFIFATLFCDLLQLPSLYTQAGMIASLIAASALGHGDSPWIYTFNRVVDNGIGVIIGTVVTLVFWPDNPRKTLVSNYTQFLNNCDRIFQDIVNNVQPEKTELSQLFTQSRNQIEQSQNLLNQATYGWAGHQITQENWSGILASQRRLLRYLFIMSNLSKNLNNSSLINEFKPDLSLFAEQITLILQDLSHLVKQETFLEIPQIESLHKQIQVARQKLFSLNQEKISHNFSSNIIYFYNFLHALNEFLKEIEQFSSSRFFVNQIKNTEPKKNFTLTIIERQKLLIILKTGATIGLCLAILNNFLGLPYNYYAIIGVIIAMQPTLGRGIIAGKQRIICTIIGTLYALIIVNTLGSNYFTLGLGVFLNIVTCAYLGFTQGYQAGCFPVIIGVLIHSNNHNDYVFGRLSETVIGVIFGVGASLLLGTETAANKLDAQIINALQKIKKSYYLIMTNYLEQNHDSQKNEAMLQEIKNIIQNQLSLQNETKQEYADGLMTSKKQRIWNYIINFEIEISRQLLYFISISSQNTNSQSTQYQKEFETILEDTVQGLNVLISSVHHQIKQPPLSLLNSSIELEKKLIEHQEQFLNIQDSFEQIVHSFVIVSTLREISGMIEQTINNFPE